MYRYPCSRSRNCEYKVKSSGGAPGTGTCVALPSSVCATSLNKPQQASTSLNKPQQASTSLNKPQQASTTSATKMAALRAVFAIAFFLGGAVAQDCPDTENCSAECGACDTDCLALLALTPPCVDPDDSTGAVNFECSAVANCAAAQAALAAHPCGTELLACGADTTCDGAVDAATADGATDEQKAACCANALCNPLAICMAGLAEGQEGQAEAAAVGCTAPTPPPPPASTSRRSPRHHNCVGHRRGAGAFCDDVKRDGQACGARSRKDLRSPRDFKHQMDRGL
eukprot:SAG31_NODE_821_length_11784_cov_62.658194_4_plen_284_part_00